MAVSNYQILKEIKGIIGLYMKMIMEYKSYDPAEMIFHIEVLR